MTTKRQDREKVIVGRRIGLRERWEQATEHLKVVGRQRALCEWIEIVGQELGLIGREMGAIGALARQQDRARAGQLEVEAATPEFTAAAKAVFTVQHLADREAPLREELDRATRRRAEARRLLEDSEVRLRQANALSQQQATRRGWSGRRRSTRAHEQWVIIQRLSPEVGELRLASEEADAAHQALAVESASLRAELEAFRKHHGASPTQLYERVEEHRRLLAGARGATAALDDQITRRRRALERHLRTQVERAQELGLVAVSLDRPELMVAAIEQSREVAELETHGLDCDDVATELERASQSVAALARRLEIEPSGSPVG